MKIITCSSITSTLINKMMVRINKKTVLVSIITMAHHTNQIKTTMKHSGHNNSDPTQDSLSRRTVDRTTDRGTYTQRPQRPSWVAKCNHVNVLEPIIRRTIAIKIQWWPSPIMALVRAFRQSKSRNSSSTVMSRT